jgi:FlaA1/EpsC-like NDP-sugar epimerase
MRRFFMTIPEAVHLVIQAGGRGRGAELFVLNMGQPMRIVDLAQDLIRLSGFQSNDIPIAFTGLRPGEKLNEELWEHDATIDRIDHPDILQIIEPDDPPSAVLSAAVETLKPAVASNDRMEIEAILASCIATFVPASAAAVHEASAKLS